jgi:malonyl-CoA O-methyltransferase
MRDLKAIGAHNATAGRPKGLTGRRALERMTAAYEEHRRDGRLPATYEVVYGQAWAPHEPSRARVLPGEVRVPITGIGRRGNSG